MSLAPTHGTYAHASTLTSAPAAAPNATEPTFQEVREAAAERVREGRRIVNGRMFTGNLVCRCGEVVSEGWMPRHIETNHPEPGNVPYHHYATQYPHDPREEQPA